MAVCGQLPAPRELRRAQLRDPDTDELLDQCMVVWLPGPASYTGEDVVELHVHGGRAVVGDVCLALGKLDGVRVADPGEFSRRAFEAGKLDLIEVEGLAALVAAETSAQRRLALRELDGVTGDQYRAWSAGLTEVLAHFEGAIDFVEEELPADLIDRSSVKMLRIEKEISQHLAAAEASERVRDGVTIALVGPPNVGKSALMNRIAGRDVAIVCAKAGTTRDVLECRLDLGGFPATLMDLAGLREADDPVEAEGVRRAWVRAETADVRLWVQDAASGAGHAELPIPLGDNDFLVRNKADLQVAQEVSKDMGRDCWAVSAKTGAGIGALLEALERVVGRLCAPAGGGVVTRERHRRAAMRARDSLRRAHAAPQMDMAAEDVRLALRALGEVTGAVRLDEVLDRIFADFCIGK